MTWKLFVDDERMPVREDEWFIARDYHDAVFLILKHGLPNYISFDHDLGSGPSGVDFVNWLVDYMLDNDMKFPKDFDYFVHSQNPIGAANIRAKMDRAVKWIGYEE